jgi:hypothetical protein
VGFYPIVWHFIDFMLIFMVFWPYLGGYWPKLSATRGGLLGFEPSTSWLYKPSHCGFLSKQSILEKIEEEFVKAKLSYAVKPKE